MRTTSSLESLNATLVRTVPNHPHFFKFMDHLKLHEYSKFLDLNTLIDGGGSPKQLERKNPRDRDRDHKIKYFTEQLKEDNIDVGLFLEAMANKNILPNAGIVLSNPI